MVAGFLAEFLAELLAELLAERDMVPVEGIEPPTFGLQNRCSTAELNRHRDGAFRVGFGLSSRRGQGKS